MEVFSFDLKGDFAYFKKNDANDIFQLSYNFIHKPAVLGILGAIKGKGYKGYQKSGKFPEYYEKLKHLKIAIKPNYEKPLSKIMSIFNNSSCLGSNEQGAWQRKEQVLVGNPEISYTIFVINFNNSFVDEIEEIKKVFRKNHTSYPLYFGKNEFFAYYDNFEEGYKIESINNSVCTLDSLFKVSSVEFERSSWSAFDVQVLQQNTSSTIYENLPFALDNNGFYEKAVFVLSRKTVNTKEEDFYNLKKNNKVFNVQFI